MVSKRSSFQYLLTSPVVSMFLNEKYIIDRDDYIGGETSLAEYRTSSDGSVVMYENKYYLPIGYMAKNGVVDVQMSNDTVFETQNKVFSAATGIDEDVYTPLDPYSFDCVNFEHKREADGLFSYDLVSGTSTGDINVNYIAPKDGMLYAWANVKSNDTISVRSDSIAHSYDIEAQRYVFPIGYYKKGEAVMLSVDAEKDAVNKIAVAYLNQDVLDKGYAALNDETISIKKHTSAMIEGTLTANEDGTFLTSIPYEKGWKLFVDGKKQPTEQAMGAFLCAEMTKGEHTIKLVYTPEGFVPGMIAAVIAILAFIFLCVNDAMKKKGVDLIAKIIKKL